MGVVRVLMIWQRHHLPKPILWIGVDIGTLLLCDLVLLLAVSGQIDEAFQKLEEAEQWSSRLAHPPTNAIVVLAHCGLKHFCGDEISIWETHTTAEAISQFEMFGECFFGITSATRNASPADAMDGLNRIKSKMETVQTAWGKSADSSLLRLFAEGLLLSREFDEGLRLVADIFLKIERTEVPGLFGTSELYLTKARMLLAKLERDGDMSLAEEADRALNSAVESAKKNNLKSMEFKSLSLLIELQRRVGNVDQEAQTRFAELYQFFTDHTKTYKPTSMKEAEQLMARLSIQSGQ